MDGESFEGSFGAEERELTDGETSFGDVEGGVGGEEGFSRVEGVGSLLEFERSESGGGGSPGEDDCRGKLRDYEGSVLRSNEGKTRRDFENGKRRTRLTSFSHQVRVPLVDLLLPSIRLVLQLGSFLPGDGELDVENSSVHDEVGGEGGGRIDGEDRRSSEGVDGLVSNLGERGASEIG